MTHSSNNAVSSHFPPFIEPSEAFDRAIAAGRLSRDKDSTLYAGDYMYMGEFEGRSMFKSILTRAYLA